MPDFSGVHDGKWVITICTVGGGISTLQLDLTDLPKQSSSDEHAEGQECPLGLVLSQVVMHSQVVTMVPGAILVRPTVLLHRNQALPPQPAQGPPIGPRAPPSNLG
jgi:hypothetical protein